MRLFLLAATALAVSAPAHAAGFGTKDIQQAVTNQTFAYEGAGGSGVVQFAAGGTMMVRAATGAVAGARWAVKGDQLCADAPVGPALGQNCFGLKAAAGGLITSNGYRLKPVR